MSQLQENLVKSAVTRLQAYDPHKRPGHVKLDANEHPFALPAVVRDAVLRALDEVPIHRYPDPEAERLRDRLAKLLDVTPTILGFFGPHVGCRRFSLARSTSRAPRPSGLRAAGARAAPRSR